MTEQERLEKNQRIKETGRETRLKRLHQVCKTYTVKIQYNALSKKQKEQLNRMFIEAKWLYNDILNFSEDKDIKGYNTKTKSVDVKTFDGSFEERELSHLGSSMKQSVLENIMGNIKGLAVRKNHGFKVGKLQFKSNYNSISLRQYNNTHRIIDSKHISIQKIKGNIKVNGLNQFYNEPNIEIATAKLLKKPDGYYIAITVYKSKDLEQPIKIIGKEIGIDFGIKTGITLSNGEKFSSVIKETERLKRLQKKFSRQQFRLTKKKKVIRQGSNNSRKTQLLIAKEHQYITNIKNDTANKLVHHILQYETVYMQDEMISNWHKGLFGKQVQHSILGRVKQKLINHPRVEVLNRSVPTTQYCPNCGQLTKHTLDKRTYHCDFCGYEDDRDINAAKNMIRLVKLAKSKVSVENSTLVPTEHRDFKPLEMKTSGIISNNNVKPLSMNQETACFSWQ